MFPHSNFSPNIFLALLLSMTKITFLKILIGEELPNIEGNEIV